jgi:hypothetical protein
VEMNSSRGAGRPSAGGPSVLVQVTVILVAGPVIGLAALLILSNYLRESGLRAAEMITYPAAAGVASLVMGLLLTTVSIPVKRLEWVKYTAIALLTGTGLALATLVVTFWLQWVARPSFGPGAFTGGYDSGYVIGEVGGHLAPGIGGLAFGFIVLMTCFVWPTNSGCGTPRGSGGELPEFVSRPRLRLSGLLVRLLVSLILGVGAGLTCVAASFAFLGLTWRYDAIVLSILLGGSSLAAGVAMALACARTEGLRKTWGLTVSLLMTPGISWLWLAVSKYYSLRKHWS